MKLCIRFLFLLLLITGCKADNFLEEKSGQNNLAYKWGLCALEATANNTETRLATFATQKAKQARGNTGGMASRGSVADDTAGAVMKTSSKQRLSAAAER
jgi:hypothetical protein